jgi:hypothetical protein
VLRAFGLAAVAASASGRRSFCGEALWRLSIAQLNGPPLLGRRSSGSDVQRVRRPKVAPVHVGGHRAGPDERRGLDDFGGWDVTSPSRTEIAGDG